MQNSGEKPHELAPGEDDRKRQFEAEKAQAARNYTAEFIDSLAARFEIRDAEKIQTMREVLHLSAWIYEMHKADAAKRARLTTIRSQLENLLERMIDAESALYSLHPAADQILWQQGNLEFLIPKHPGNALFQGPMGQTIFQREVEPDTYQFLHLDQLQMREALELIGNFAWHALKRLGPGRRGPRPDYALQLFVTDMRQLWMGVLGREFTFGPRKGGGYTPAYDFCRATLEALDPSVTLLALQTAIRKAITNARLRSGAPAKRNLRKNPPKEK